MHMNAFLRAIELSHGIGVQILALKKLTWIIAVQKHG